ncbi:hypothetical protein [Psychrobacillus sp. OK032]|uniref:hypothetical protein n=1 Tax=Psychrobacillus sp. OK032 TaxID=1884358 RepID=UPI0008B65C0F|nr:hypothetical protein [Psychrobacillus sp. OK032]SES30939.1 hypothetical protein SAMN05518872_107238 [Psychrobacillus sp. OK032]
MKKIIGTIVLFAVLLSASTIYASGLPQNTLSKWYGQSFEKESGSKREFVSSDIENTFEEVNTFLLETLESFQSSIAGIIDNQIKESKAGIEGYQQDTKSQLDQSVAELKKVNLEDYVDNEKIENKIDQDIEEVLIEVFGN